MGTIVSDLLGPMKEAAFACASITPLSRGNQTSPPVKRGASFKGSAPVKAGMGAAEADADAADADDAAAAIGTTATGPSAAVAVAAAAAAPAPLLEPEDAVGAESGVVRFLGGIGFFLFSWEVETPLRAF